MELRDYLRILRRGWPLVLVFLVLGVGAGVGITVTSTKIYEASVQLFVATSTSQSAADLASGNTFTQDRVQSYTAIATSPQVTGPVIQRLGLKLTESELASKISADAPQNEVLLNLHVTDPDPSTAATMANALAAQFATVVENTEKTDARGKSVVRLTVIHPATVPTSPIKPSKILNVGLGFVIGLLVGVGVVVLRDVLDTSVKGPADFEVLGVPVLGNVPFDKRTARTPVAFRGDLHSARSEAYRQLRTNLQFVNVDNPPHVISVTSAVPGEGKTTTALNLAAAMAEAGARVCLIEADLRRPTLADALGLIGEVGFTTALIGKTPVETVLQNAGRNLAVLTSGPIPPNPSELLITTHARDIIHSIAEQVDFVIVDTPPLLPVTDGAAVATMADATLLVTRTGKTTYEQAVRAVEALEKVGKRPVGAILNMVTRGQGSYSDEYGYYYAYRPRGKRGRSATPVLHGADDTPQRPPADAPLAWLDDDPALVMAQPAPHEEPSDSGPQARPRHVAGPPTPPDGPTANPVNGTGFPGQPTGPTGAPPGHAGYVPPGHWGGPGQP